MYIFAFFSSTGARPAAPDAGKMIRLTADSGDSAKNEEPEENIELLDEGERAGAAAHPIEKGAGGVIEEEDVLIIEDEEEENIIEQEVGPVEQPKHADTAAAPVTGQQPLPRHAAEQPAVSPSRDTTAAVTVKPAGESGTAAVIEKERSINFARNLREYRSPRTAMFLSLLLPGLGQAYAKKYVKSLIFSLAEAAIIGTGIRYAMKGKAEKEDAYTFADRYFSLDSFWTYYKNLDSLLNRRLSIDTMKLADIKSMVIWDSTEFVNDAKARNTSFYETIDRDALVQGWIDCEPKIDLAQNGFIEDYAKYRYAPMQEPGAGDTIWLLYQIEKTTGDTVGEYLWGYSNRQLEYRGMMRKSNDYYRISTNVLFLLIANHVISAVDAMISAKAYNDELLGKQSFWRRIRLDQQMAFTETGVASTFGVQVRF